MRKVQVDGDADIPADCRAYILPPVRLHSVPHPMHLLSRVQLLICYDIKVPLIFSTISHRRCDEDTLRNNSSTHVYFLTLLSSSVIL